MGATDLMTVDDMLNAVGLTGVLFYFLTPTIVVILCAYAYNRHKKNKALKDKQKLSLKNNTAIGKETIEDDTKAIKVLNNTPEKPVELGKFRALTLEFDEHGHVKNK